MTAPETCEPPEEHMPHTYHWLQHGEWIEPAYWLQGRAWMILGTSCVESADHMAEIGWRYVAPAIPPTQEG
jgi:hypothetical protein